MSKKSHYLKFPLIFGLLLFISCGEDDEKKGETLISKFKISKAILANDVVTSIETATLSAGTDISDAINSAFFAEIQCLDNSGKALELTDENKIFYLCLNESKKEEKGSWSINEDRSELSLNLVINESLVPLLLKNLVETDSYVSGDVSSIPVPPIILSAVNGEFIKVKDAAVLIGLELTLDKID